MGLPKVIGNQVQNPHGLAGRLVFGWMTRMTIRHARWTIDLMKIQETDSVLEIGFGNGESIRLLASRVPGGHVKGAEISRTAIAMASKKNGRAIAEGRVELVRAAGGTLPFDDGSFDKACTVNTIYVIAEPGAVFKEMFRVLRSGGLAAVSFPVRENFMRFRPARTNGFHFHELEDIEASFREAGFRDVRIERNDAVRFGGHCVLGRR